MSNRIVIDDGRKEFVIENKLGEELGRFSLNPSDTNIVKRYDEVAEDFARLDNILNQEDTTKGWSEAEDFIKEKLDYILGYNVSDDFFKIMGAFTPLASGKFFAEEVIDAIGRVISSETGARVKKLTANLSKYTSKYTGKKHG